MVVGLVEDDNQLFLRQKNSYFFAYEIVPDIYSNKDASGALYTMGDDEGTLQTEYDDICERKTF